MNGIVDAILLVCAGMAGVGLLVALVVVVILYIFRSVK